MVFNSEFKGLSISVDTVGSMTRLEPRTSEQ